MNDIMNLLFILRRSLCKIHIFQDGSIFPIENRECLEAYIFYTVGCVAVSDRPEGPFIGLTYIITVVVLQEAPSVNITTDRVVSVDTNNNAIPLEAIQPGQLVRVEHAIFETLSIPPQSPAYLVQVSMS
jgi:hypothetical protein